MSEGTAWRARVTMCGALKDAMTTLDKTLLNLSPRAHFVPPRGGALARP